MTLSSSEHPQSQAIETARLYSQWDIDTLTSFHNPETDFRELHIRYNDGQKKSFSIPLGDWGLYDMETLLTMVHTDWPND